MKGFLLLFGKTKKAAKVHFLLKDGQKLGKWDFSLKRAGLLSFFKGKSKT